MAISRGLAGRGGPGGRVRGRRVAGAAGSGAGGAGGAACGWSAGIVAFLGVGGVAAATEVQGNLMIIPEKWLC